MDIKEIIAQMQALFGQLAQAVSGAGATDEGSIDTVQNELDEMNPEDEEAKKAKKAADEEKKKEVTVAKDATTGQVVTDEGVTADDTADQRLDEVNDDSTSEALQAVTKSLAVLTKGVASTKDKYAAKAEVQKIVKSLSSIGQILKAIGEKVNVQDEAIHNLYDSLGMVEEVEKAMKSADADKKKGEQTKVVFDNPQEFMEGLAEVAKVFKSKDGDNTPKDTKKGITTTEAVKKMRDAARAGQE